MSSFSENFQREDPSQEGIASLDGSAFHSFESVMLLVAIISLIIVILHRLNIEKKYSGKEYKNCTCKACNSRLNAYYNRERKKNINFTFYIYIVITICLFYLLTLSLIQVQKNSRKIKSFDPYVILDIPINANISEIKKSYKNLAIKYHPDKNPNDIRARAKFMLINKAYKSLTDEEGKKNFEKYGNPDGPQPMKVSIGLPSFILKKKNHFPILLLFVIFILVIFPSCFMAWFKYSESYDDSGMKSENEKIFYQFMNENILLEQMPFVLGMAQEFLNLTVHFEEDKPLIKAYRRYINYMCKHKPEYICPQNKKAICLFYSYIFREPLKIDNYQDFTEKILFPSDLLIRNIYKMCLDITMYHQYEPLLFLKNFGYKCLQTVVKFSENLHQQLNQDDIFSPFFQFPYFNNDKILLLKSAYNRIFDKDTCFTDFMKMNIEERNNILKKAFVEEEINDINKAIESIPLYDLDVKVFTEGFDDIIVGDGVSIKVTVKRNNLKEGQIVGLTHSLGFTELFEEKIALFLLLIDETKDDKEKIMIIDQTIKSVTEQITEHTFFYYFEKEKKYKIVLDLMSFNYKGVNLSKEVEVNVKKNSEKRKQQLKEIEKRKIKKIELSYFQKMLNIIEDEDEEEEEEEEEEDDKNEEKDKDKDKDKNKENEGNDEKDKKEGYKKDEKEEDKKEKYEKEEDKNDENKEHEKQA